jgi:DNA-binding GntR family transcriptional regulator
VALLEALEAHDPERAAEAMRVHAREAEAHLLAATGDHGLVRRRAVPADVQEA